MFSSGKKYYDIKEVLLIKRSETAAAEPGKWSIPGGFVDTYSKRNEPWKAG
jgi:ADP-ribose pyrophosphatase YjhB (NUDIX family)